MKNALEAVPAGDALDAAPTTGAKNVAPATTPLNDILSRDTAVIRWGIVGTGRIARRFAQGLAHVPAARLTALWSRRSESAAAFAGDFAVKLRPRLPKSERCARTCDGAAFRASLMLRSAMPPGPRLS